MGYAFISYSSKNKSSADAINELFGRNGIRTWMAPGDIPAGKEYADIITEALKQCACFILILTEQSQNSQWVSKELERAVSYKKPIIPVVLEHIELEGKFELYISEYQLVALKKIDENTEEMQRILAAIKAHTDLDATISHPYQPALTTPTRMEASGLREGGSVEFGRYYQEDEDALLPIRWRILKIKNGKALLISCEALDAQPFNTDIGTNLWKDCSLRKWLNGEFYETAFSEEEKKMIVPTSVFTERSNRTTDPVFLLSREEAQQYFPSDPERRCKPTSYAKGNGVYPSINPNCLGYCWWWLRTLCSNPRHASYIGFDGSTRNYAFVADDSAGVRPAINVSVAVFQK